MRLFGRIKHAVPGPPEGAHGRRNVDGSYFSIWLCENGHGGVGSPTDTDRGRCNSCMFDQMKTGDYKAPISSVWRLATPKEAHDFLFTLEGFGMYSGVGFDLLPEVAHAV